MVFGKKKAKDKGKVSPSTSATGGALPSFPGAELVAQQQAALATANNNLATGPNTAAFLMLCASGGRRGRREEAEPTVHVNFYVIFFL